MPLSDSNNDLKLSNVDFVLDKSILLSPNNLLIMTNFGMNLINLFITFFNESKAATVFSVSISFDNVDI